MRPELPTGKHTLSVLVENKPGVLARVAGLFSRRGYNIDSLAVGPTEHPEVSRMTIVVNVETSPLEQVTKQLNKLVEVLKVVELDGGGSVNRELLLVKVRADVESRSQVLDAVQLFKARVVDVAPDAITIEVTGNADKLAGFLAVVEPFGIRELVQSGMVAIGRNNMSEFAFSGLGINPHYGTPENPHSTDVPRIPGGSSSGAGVAVAAGLVPVAMGTDTGVPFTDHGNNLDEVTYLVEMGLTPMEALTVTTFEAAKLLKMSDRIGSLEVGKLADYVVIDGDPLADIKILQDKSRILTVAIGGKTMVERAPLKR